MTQRVPKFAEFLRKRGEGRSFQEVANRMKAVGVTRVKSAVSSYESEKFARVPPIDVIRAYSAAYDVPFEELVDRLLEELGVKPVEWRIRALRPREQRAWTHADDDSRRAAVAVLRLGRLGAQTGEPPPDRPLAKIRLIDFLANDDGNAGELESDQAGEP